MNDVTRSKFLPCPFCGCQNIFVEPDERGSGGQWVAPIHVGCTSCKAEQMDDDVDGAVGRWNQRARVMVPQAAKGTPMSKPNLPPLPDLPEKEITDVICNDDGDEWPLREWLEEDLRAWATAYAEEAVRQALAEVAKAISTQADAQRVNYEQSGRNSYYEGMADGLDVAEQKVLGAIPDNSPGHKPASVDTSSGHSSAPEISKSLPTEPLQVFADGLWTYDGTGQAFSHTDLDAEAYVRYRDFLTYPPETRDG